MYCSRASVWVVHGGYQTPTCNHVSWFKWNSYSMMGRALFINFTHSLTRSLTHSLTHPLYAEWPSGTSFQCYSLLQADSLFSEDNTDWQVPPHSIQIRIQRNDIRWLHKSCSIKALMKSSAAYQHSSRSSLDCENEHWNCEGYATFLLV